MSTSSDALRANSLALIQSRLRSTIKPSELTIHTSTLVQGNAVTWTHTIVLILEEHYSKCLDHLRNLLRNLSLNDRHQAWEVALRWAYLCFSHLKWVAIESTSIRADLHQLGLDPSHPSPSRSHGHFPLTVP